MCYSPFTKRNKDTNENQNFPCGKCPKCLARRVSSWSFRLMQEYNRPETVSAHFITLTYDTPNIRLTPNGFPTLRKSDLQLFFKRLRKAQYGSSAGNIKYYACGEYGGKTKRPHYHVILYNAKLELIDPAWNLGNVHYGTLTEASVGYTLKYINKPSKVPLHQRDDRQKEFALMSKNLATTI